MTAATTEKKPRPSRRAAVPAVDTDAPSTSSVVDALAATPAAAGVVVALPLAALHPHPRNPRRDLGDLTELADSIRAHGIRQNLLVVPDPDHPGEYRIVIGHRRAAAAALAGVDTVPAAVDPSLDVAGQIELMLLENLQRTDLTAIEEADGYQGLLDLGLSAKAIADRTGRSYTTVRARLRLGGLPVAARAAVHEHRATLEDAAALEEFADDLDTQAALAEVMGTRNFARELEDARQKAKRRRALAPLLDRLVEIGATQLPANEWGAPDGSKTAARVYVGYGAPEGVDAALAALADGTADWSWRQYYSELIIFRPLTAEEAAAEKEAAAKEPAWQVEQRKRQEERAALEARWGEHAGATRATREAFLRSLLAHKELTKAQVDALVGYVGFELLTGAALEDTRSTYIDARYLPGWLGVDVDAIVAQANDEGIDEDDAVDVEIHQAIANMPAGHRLLTAAAAGIEPIDWFTWAEPIRPVRAYYALLEELGYAVSDAEREALAESGESS